MTMELGNIFLVASIIVLYNVGCTKSETWVPATSSEVYKHNSSRATPFSSTVASLSPGIKESNDHQDVTPRSVYPNRRDLNSRAMQITVTPTEMAVTDNNRLKDVTATTSFYPSRHYDSKQASEDDNSNTTVTTQEYPGRRHYYNSRRERPQQKVEKIQEPVKIPGGAAAAAAGLTKPTRYHYYPHNQHIYLLPECAIQQVCNAVYVRLNFTQPLCACPSRYRDPCSASTNTDDLHSTELITDPRGKALTLAKTCEPVAEMRECRAPRDWSLLALQNIRTGKSHYLVICRCPPTNILEGPMSHDQPTYASVPGIRVYGMMCVQVNNRRGRHLRSARSSGRSMPRLPWRRVNEMVDALHWDD